MNQEKLIELLSPIRQYILNNELDRDDIHVVVANHLPSEEELTEIAAYIKANVPNAFKMTKPENVLDRTRQILTQALEESAYGVWDEKYGRVKKTFFTQEEIDEEMSKDMFWEDEYGHGEGYDD
jgi:hypothetical protein